MKSLDNILESLLDDNFDVTAADINPIINIIRKYKEPLISLVANRKLDSQDFTELYDITTNNHVMKLLGFKEVPKKIFYKIPTLIVGIDYGNPTIAIYMSDKYKIRQKSGAEFIAYDTIMFSGSRWTDCHAWCTIYNSDCIQKFKKMWQMPDDLAKKIKETLR